MTLHGSFLVLESAVASTESSTLGCAVSKDRVPAVVEKADSGEEVAPV